MRGVGRARVYKAQHTDQPGPPVPTTPMLPLKQCGWLRTIHVERPSRI